MATIGFPLAEMQRMERDGYVCQVCRSRVIVAWGGIYGIGQYILRCTKDIKHAGVVRPYIPTAYEIIEKREIEAMTQSNTSVAVRRMTALSQARANQIIESLWGSAPQIEKLKAAMICVDYGLNPLQKHLFLVGYEHKENGKVDRIDWSIIYGIKAKRVIAYRHGYFAYSDNTPRLMTEEEEKRVYGDADPKYARAITILVDEKGNRYPGYGQWAKTKTYDNKESPNNPKGSDKGNTISNMAMIRSESNALEKFAPGEMPPPGETIDAEFEELPDHSGLKADAVTGEIKEIITAPKLEPQAKERMTPAPAATTPPTHIFGVDMAWLNESLHTLNWKGVIKDYLAPKFQCLSPRVSGCLLEMTPEQVTVFVKEVQNRLDILNGQSKEASPDIPF
jgi:RecT family